MLHSHLLLQSIRSRSFTCRGMSVGAIELWADFTRIRERFGGVFSFWRKNNNFCSCYYFSLFAGFVGRLLYPR